MLDVIRSYQALGLDYTLNAALASGRSLGLIEGEDDYEILYDELPKDNDVVFSGNYWPGSPSIRKLDWQNNFDIPMFISIFVSHINKWHVSKIDLLRNG